MIRIRLGKDHWQGCYDSDREEWCLVVEEKYLRSIPVDAQIKDDGTDWWNCYLVKVKWEPKSMTYELIYKEY